ncbi:DUF4347 domain-containing protein [Chryseobacterium gwangjuense]|uniref:DUF4347 domain-containing protein n=1 Tax=Chryseobacterium gwangjuense TaxID=1069980 RepID=UPI001E55D14A|nr:DUF4347 domain-containing protein [Chryseobacterium gwangjuense]MCE3074614.1 DUF4347 domain-containing protein [Chryseobacterium gwangjuense]
MKKRIFIAFLLILLLYMGKMRASIFLDLALIDLKIKSRDHTKAFHLLSHGKPGKLYINGHWLDQEGIYRFLIDKVKNKNELLIYGCEFAKGKKGIEVVKYLEKKLKVKVSASTDITGKDGNWILEYGNSPNTLKPVYKGNLQLDNLHYLNPVVFTNYPLDITQEFVYLSTPSVSDINVTINFASGNGSPRISVLDLSSNTSSIITNGSVILNSSQPKRISFVNSADVILLPGQSPVTLSSTAAGTIISGNSAGLVFNSASNFYVNYRGRQLNHAGTVLTKGKAALGKEFRWGGTPIQNSTASTDVGNVLSIMATDDDTNINISDLDPGMEFLNGSNPTPLIGTSLYRTLQKGETFILYAPVKTNGVSIQDTGWLGAKIVSNKDVSVVVGGLMMLGASGTARDFGLDQLVPVSQIGVEYIVMQGAGGNNERVIVVATDDNTMVYLNGSLTPIATLVNAGDYTVINASGNFNANQNLYLKTNKPSYVYHKIYGSSGGATNNIVLVAPLSCFGQNEINLISDAHKIGNTGYANTVLSVLSASGATPVVTINGTPVIPSQSAGSVDGNVNWVSYRYAIGDAVNDVKNVKVTSTAPIQADLLGADTNAGFGGYFSGFGTLPIVTISLSTPYEQPCIGQSTLSVPAGLGTYQWYKNGTIISAATNNVYVLPATDTTSAEYSVIVITPGGCEIHSDFVVSDICPCSKPGAIGTPNSGTKLGITIRDVRSSNNWPHDVNNGFLALESNDKGFVITRLSDPETAITQPVEGMIVYDTDDNCIKLYNGTSWNCIQQTCN